MTTYKIPSKYLILPYLIRHEIEGFESLSSPDAVVLAPKMVDCRQWFHEFVDLVLTKIERKVFFPIIRLTDGDYPFLFGYDIPELREPQIKRFFQWSRCRVKKILGRDKRFVAQVKDGYVSADYSWQEVKQQRDTHWQNILFLGRQGILAWHFTFGPRPFQEKWHPSIQQAIEKANFEINESNYYPFYFIYALLSGPRRRQLYQNRRILFVTTADEKKKETIERNLRQEGVSEIHWADSTPPTSMLGDIDVMPFLGKVDLAFVAKGLPKANVIRKMEKLGVPVIDVGVFAEIWSNNASAEQRAYCQMDEKKI